MKAWPLSAKLVAVLLGSLLSVSLLANYRAVEREASRPIALTSEEMLGMAQSHFPKEFSSAGNPNNLAMAFVLDQSRRVLGKALTNTSAEESAQATLQRSLPTFNISKIAAAGTVCFAESQPRHGKFCVLWAVPLP